MTLPYTKTTKPSLQDSLLALSLIGLTFLLGYQVQQNDFQEIISYYLPFFLIYLWAFKKGNVRFFLIIGILLRIILLFSMPNLSDDIYRFVWDGRLLVNGLNPFDHLPNYYIENDLSIQGITQELYNQLNSPEYFTIYPPVAQALFAFAVWLFPESILGSAIVMKSFLLLCEIGSIYLIVQILKRFKLPERNVLLYALNPLIIIEIMGNLHFEGALIFFLLLSIYWILLAFENDVFNRKFFYLSALAFSLSIASKLLSLVFLPFYIKRLGWRRSLEYFSIIGIATLLFFFPLINGVFIENFGNSLNLYFQKFEFNASVYYIARWVGFKIVGWNLIAIIGPKLALCTLVCISLLAFFEWEKGILRSIFSIQKPLFKTTLASLTNFFQHLFQYKPDWKGLPLKMLFAFCIYLLFTTTVHPWYTALPIVLCCFTRFRFPILWSALIFLTYINYSYEEYFENLWIVGLEYGLVLFYFLLEIWKPALFLSKKTTSNAG